MMLVFCGGQWVGLEMEVGRSDGQNISRAVFIPGTRAVREGLEETD